MDPSLRGSHSDREPEFVECGCQPVGGRGLDSQFVMSASQVLDELQLAI